MNSVSIDRLLPGDLIDRLLHLRFYEFARTEENDDEYEFYANDQGIDGADQGIDDADQGIDDANPTRPALSHPVLHIEWDELELEASPVIFDIESVIELSDLECETPPEWYELDDCDASEDVSKLSNHGISANVETTQRTVIEDESDATVAWMV